MEKYPDYNNSILSVTSSVLKHYGVKTDHVTNKTVDDRLSEKPRNVILFVLDGMGINMVQKLPERSFFRKHLSGTISSVFPSTTVAATTTLKTGLTPAEHGRLGMYLYFEEAGDIVSAFKNERLSDGAIQPGLRLIDKYTPAEKIFSLIEKSSSDVEAVEISQFSEFKAKSISEVCKYALNVSDKPGSHFLYCYWDQPDRDAHIYGEDSLKVLTDLLYFDFQIKKLCRRLKDDTAFILTSDHGHMNTKWIVIDDYPKLSHMLERRPSIERRATSFLVKDGMKDAFKNEFISTFKNKFLLLTYDEVIEKKLLGEGKECKMCRSFIGDYLAVATGEYSFALTSEDVKMKSCHAGMTDLEMNVPLIIQ